VSYLSSKASSVVLGGARSTWAREGVAVRRTARTRERVVFRGAVGSVQAGQVLGCAGHMANVWPAAAHCAAGFPEIPDRSPLISGEVLDLRTT